MAGAKEVKTKINSVQNTRKITKAMEMVAASKMRRAQERVDATRPYADKIRRTASHVIQASIGHNHPFQVEREAKRVGIIVISTDRGLCGGLNVNLFRKVLAEMRGWRDDNVAVDLVVIGRKGLSFFRRFTEVKANVVDLGDRPRLAELIGSIQVMLNAYRDGDIDRLFLMGNEFVNTMTQRPYRQQLLPVEASADEGLANQWDYIYEPEDSSLVDLVLRRFVEAQIYRGAVENVACEMAARMVAMKSASDNASDIIDDLQLEYNKQRQAAITQELTEIVAGAAAVS